MKDKFFDEEEMKKAKKNQSEKVINIENRQRRLKMQVILDPRKKIKGRNIIDI